MDYATFRNLNGDIGLPEGSVSAIKCLLGDLSSTSLFKNRTSTEQSKCLYLLVS